MVMSLASNPLSKRFVLFALLAILIMSMCVRYPTTPHEMGADGFMNNILADSISENGYAKWHISAYSYFGMGPFSYPSAIHFLLSSISQLTGFNMEITVLALNLAIALCGVLFTFLFVRDLFKD